MRASLAASSAGVRGASAARSSSASEPAGYHVRGDRIAPLAGLLILTAALGASLGLMLGTLVPVTCLPCCSRSSSPR